MLKKIFFSRTTRPISTKHGRKHAGDGDSDLFKQRGWPLLGPNKGQNKDNFNKSLKIFFS